MITPIDALINTNTRIIYEYDFTPIANNIPKKQYTKTNEDYFISDEDKCIIIKKNQLLMYTKIKIIYFSEL